MACFVPGTNIIASNAGHYVPPRKPLVSIQKCAKRSTPCPFDRQRVPSGYSCPVAEGSPGWLLVLGSGWLGTAVVSQGTGPWERHDDLLGEEVA